MRRISQLRLFVQLCAVIAETTSSTPLFSSSSRRRSNNVSAVFQWHRGTISSAFRRKDHLNDGGLNEITNDAITSNRNVVATGMSTAIAQTSAIPKIAISKTKKELMNLLSGGLAGTMASCITNPLEVVKTQLQSSSTSSTTTGGGLASLSGRPWSVAQAVWEADGPAGFFRGIRPTLMGILPGRSVYFYVYRQTKATLAMVPWVGEGDGNALLSGLAAGVASNTLTNPIFLVKTRMQLLAGVGSGAASVGVSGQVAYRGYRDAVATIAREEGLGGFYKGLFASYWGCAEGGIQFVVYERLKRRQERLGSLEGRSSSSLSKWETFGTAAVAKAVASIVTYPHEVARTRMREQACSGVYKYNGMWRTLRLVAKEEGRGGLYAGMGLHLVKVVPNSALMFLAYEVVNSWISRRYTVVETAPVPVPV